MSKFSIGSVHEVKAGKLEVVEQISSSKVKVRFIDTGYEREAQTAHIEVGSVQDRLRKSVNSIGFLGVGNYPTRIDGKLTPAYAKWKSMLERCYPQSESQRLKYVDYSDCSVSSDWHNFQNFAEWFNSHKFDSDWQLDKDLKIAGNKVYSSDTCLLLPSDIHHLFNVGHGQKKLDANMKLGVSVAGGFYVATFKGKELGKFKTPWEAYSEYCKAKSDALKTALKEYRKLDVLAVDTCRFVMAALYRQLGLPYKFMEAA